MTAAIATAPKPGTGPTPGAPFPLASPGDRRIDMIGYVFVAFFSVPFFLFNILPVFFGVYVAFTRWSIVGSPHWVGFDNFTNALKDKWVWTAFENVLLYGIIIVPSVTALGLLFALYVNKRYPLSGLARTFFFAPNVVSATVIGLVWVWILDTQYGLVNHYLKYLGIDAVPWLTSSEWSLVGVSIASVWWDLGLAFVLFLAALQDIPSDIVEAAQVDGAGRWSRFRFIILPHLRPVLSMVLTLQLIATFRIFSQVYVMTSGGPGLSSASVIYYVYNVAIVRNQFGQASAVSLMLFGAILVVATALRLVLKERV
jgi:multiple sugar transport system permease protein